MLLIYTFLRKYRPSLRFAAGWVLLLVFLQCQAGELPPSVIKALEKAGIDAANTAVFVQRVDVDQALVAHNITQPMNPASVMKLVTTYAALELLGPAYTWKTEVLADTQPVDGVLKGNLYLRGNGAPDLNIEQFWLMLSQLRARGLQRIEGDLVLDRTVFSLAPHNPGAFDNKPLRPYNVGADALLINLNSLHFLLRPDQTNNSVAIIPLTPADDLQISNRLRLEKGYCGDWQQKFKVTVNDMLIDFEGVFPISCQERNLYLSAWAPDIMAARLFRRLWREVGGSFRGNVRSGIAPDESQMLMAHQSRSLGEIVHDTNKYSNNVMARHLFLSLDQSQPATEEGAAESVHAWLLADKRISMPDLVLENGSGLSRKERITAKGMGEMLLAAWQSPMMPEFMASLPIAGNDGTLRKRLNNTALAGRAHLKTGYLEGVRAIAGYVLDLQGRRWAVVFFINDANAWQGKEPIDEFLSWVAEDPSIY